MGTPAFHFTAPALLAVMLLAAPALAATNAPTASPIPRRSLVKHLLWYVPNRFCDLADILRLRLRVGPGLSLNARATKWATFYAGEHHTAFAGLPGPRLEPAWPIPAGIEEEKGLTLLAVDATDTLPFEPRYSNSEFTLGAQVLVVGAEAGFDPVELVDFLLGFAFLDIRRDDH